MSKQKLDFFSKVEKIVSKDFLNFFSYFKIFLLYFKRILNYLHLLMVH